MAIQRFAVDSGDGRFTNKVYAWAKGEDPRVVMPVKGVASFDRAQPVHGPTKVAIKTETGALIKNAGSLWTISVAVFKSETVRWLNLARPTDESLAAGDGFPAGFVHLPIGIDSEWFEQLCAERLAARKLKTGFTKREWQKTRERNEAFDCRVYARAAAWSEGVDFWDDSRWERLEKQFGERPDDVAPAIVHEVIEDEVDEAPSAAPAAPHTALSPGPPVAEAGQIRAKRFFRFGSSSSSYMR